MFGCTDCANADEEAKAQLISTKGKTNFIKILRLVEQKSDCAGKAAEPQFPKFPDTLDKSRR